MHVHLIPTIYTENGVLTHQVDKRCEKQPFFLNLSWERKS